MTTKSISERVAAGIQLLGDTRCRKLNIATLNVGSLDNCPIGQLFGYGAFSSSLHRLGVDVEEDGRPEAAYGFECYGDVSSELYDELTAEWIRQLRLIETPT